MKIKSVVLIASSLLACALLQACHGSHSSDAITPTPPTSVQPSTLDTPQVQALTQTSSETADPIAVNEGPVTVAGSSDETSDPVAVNSP